MNVSLNNIDATKGIVKIEIVKEDYADKVEKGLKNYRQKANIPGFRKGMVPMSMVKKMFGKQVLADEINKLVGEALFGYIRDNKLNVLGEPMPNMTEQKEINFDTQESFEFCFDVAFAPEINVVVSKDDKLPYYQVKIDDEIVGKQMEAYQAQLGTYEDADTVEEKDIVKGVVAELDENGQPKEGGVVVEEAMLLPQFIKDEAEKAKFVGAAKNTVIVFNPSRAFEGSDAEMASFFKKDKKEVENLIGDFSFEISNISRHKNAEVNQELFDKVFGEGVVTSEEEFKNKIKEAIEEQFVPQGDFKFLEDARDLLKEKAGELTYADDILKRWLLVANEKTTPEKVEHDFPQVLNDLSNHLIREKLVKDNNITVEETDLYDFAQKVAKAQFAQYGMLSVPEDALDKYTKDMLKHKETRQNIIDRVVESKLAAWLKSQVTLDIKEVTPDEFNKLFTAE
jgi:trigger factor